MRWFSESSVNASENRVNEIGLNKLILCDPSDFTLFVKPLFWNLQT